MKLFITGATGSIGHAIAMLAGEMGIEYRGVGSSQLDITRGNRVWRMVRREKPSLVINAASFNCLDRAEKNTSRCMQVNQIGSEAVAKVCNRFGIPLIHLSSSYVFDGQKSSPYHEEDATNPVSVFGRSKWLGEEAIRRTLAKHIILRTEWVFGGTGHCFVKRIIERGLKGKDIVVSKDYQTSPTSAEDLARVVIGMALQINEGATNWGTYHYSGDGAVNFYELIQRVFNQAQSSGLELDTSVRVADKKDPWLALRPLNSRLNCKRILDDFGVKQRGWQDDLTRVVDTVVSATQVPKAKSS